jgi:hypothetical protein
MLLTKAHDHCLLKQQLQLKELKSNDLIPKSTFGLLLSQRNQILSIQNRHIDIVGTFVELIFDKEILRL